MEYNDIYDENRRLTGRLHRRGDRWRKGEYGLVVCVWVYDGKGNLLVVYHGTSQGGFTVFEDTDDIGYFFTDSRYTAKTYSGTNDLFEAKAIQSWGEAISIAEEYGHEMKKC